MQENISKKAVATFLYDYVIEQDFFRLSKFFRGVFDDKRKADYLTDKIFDCGDNGSGQEGVLLVLQKIDESTYESIKNKVLSYT